MNDKKEAVNSKEIAKLWEEIGAVQEDGITEEDFIGESTIEIETIEDLYGKKEPKKEQ